MRRGAANNMHPLRWGEAQTENFYRILKSNNFMKQNQVIFEL